MRALPSHNPTQMIKYASWPRGEEETRLSAKQLCASSILAVASDMKILSIKTVWGVVLSLILLASIHKNTHAQEFNSQKAYQDYQYTLSQYSQAFSDHQFAKTNYLNNRTLSLKDDARLNTQTMLVARDQLLAVYLTMLRMNVYEQGGLLDDEKNRIFSKIDSEIEWYNTDKTRYSSADSLELLFEKSRESKNRYEEVTSVIVNEALAYISLGQEIGFRLRHEQIYDSLRSLIEAGTLSGKLSMQPFNHWLIDIDSTIQELQQNEESTRQEISKIETDSRYSETFCEDCTEIMSASVPKLSQLNKYLTEVLNYLINHQ